MQCNYPMHLQFLGISKYMRNIWKNEQIISDEKLIAIQKRVDSFKTPTSLGRIPFKIASGFSNFSADQWKNWTLYFSLFALKGILPYNHYNLWHKYVKICHTFCTHSISLADVNAGRQKYLILAQSMRNCMVQSILP